MCRPLAVLGATLSGSSSWVSRSVSGVPAFIDPRADRAELALQNYRALDQKLVIPEFSQPRTLENSENRSQKWGSSPPEHVARIHATCKWLKFKHLRHESFYQEAGLDQHVDVGG